MSIHSIAAGGASKGYVETVGTPGWVARDLQAGEVNGGHDETTDVA